MYILVKTLSALKRGSSYARPQAAGARDVGNLRVLTYNIFAGKFTLDPARIEAQIKAVRAIDADIICLQEVRF